MDKLLEDIIANSDKFKGSNIYYQKEIEDIAKEIEFETGISSAKVKLVITSYFRFMKQVILRCKRPKDKEFDFNNYKSIRIPFFGKFSPKLGFKKKYKNKEGDEEN